MNKRLRGFALPAVALAVLTALTFLATGARPVLAATFPFVNIVDGAGNVIQAAGNANDAIGGLTTLGTAAFNLGYNGTSWDRLRTVAGVNGVFTNKILAIGLCDPVSVLVNACASVSQPGSQDALGTGIPSVWTGSYALVFNGTTWDRQRGRNGEQQVQTEGNAKTKATATACTSVTGTAGTLHEVVAAGSETATLTIYDENGSPTCSAADIVYNKVPPNGAPDKVDMPVSNGIAYKLSAAAAVNDYITSN